MKMQDCRKKNSLQEYPEHLFNNSVVKERRQTYVSSENYERVRTLLSVIAPTVIQPAAT